MYLTGLTLEVQGMAASLEAPSLVMLEIASPYTGIRHLMESMTSDGPLVICGTAWIEGKLFLPVHANGADFEFLKTNWLAQYAEPYGNKVATALGWVH